jgi:uridine phosphorylase
MELLNPGKRKSDPSIPDDAVMVFIESDLTRFGRLYRARETRFSGGVLFRLYLTETSPGLSLAGPFLGAPHAVMGLEKLMTLGAGRIWVLGWCGSLQPDLRIGDLILPDTALSEEGTSAHYPVDSPMKRTDPELNGILVSVLKQEGIPVQKGRVWTTDAPYRETRSKVQTYRDKGILGVEMEMSALMAAAAFRGARLSGLLVVSDELFGLSWNAGFSSPALRDGTRTAMDMILKAISSLTP